MQRLQKLIAAAGVASRRQAETLITAGRVTVNGQVITELGTRVDPAGDVVAVDGVPLTQPAHRTLLLHKPAGYVTTCEDPQGRPTVMALVPPIPGLHPIGRLDQDTTGLLLLTNNGALTFALTHPRHHVSKVYRAGVQGNPPDAGLRSLEEGITLEDGLTAPAHVRVVARGPQESLIDLTIHEGRKRQVRRMFAAIGHPVRTLARLRLGPLTLGDLPEGAWRELTPLELAALNQAAGRRGE
jgi:23S rRNA pseudouridine2605 synthase